MSKGSHEPARRASHPAPAATVGDPGGYRLCRTRRSHAAAAAPDPRPGQAHTATTLASNVGKRLDATLKHLVALRGAGLVVTAENPQDGRRLLYRLSPAIPVTNTAAGWEMDFGYCLVRC